MNARRGGHSLRRRLPILIFLLVGGLGATFAWMALTQVQRALRTSETDRLTAAARQVAAVLDQSAKARLADTVRLAEDPRVRRALLDTPDESLGQSLVSRNASTALLLYDRDGHLLRRIGAARGGPPAPTVAPSQGVSPFVADDGRIWYYTTVPISSDSDEGPSPMLAVQRVVGSSQAAALLERLIGSGAVLKFGNSSGKIWTDLSAPTDPPPVNPSGATTYVSEGDLWIGVAIPVTDTPWLVWVSVAEETMLAPSRVLLRRMLPLTLMLTVIGAIAVYAVSGRITKPLETLARASDAIAAGDHSRRVPLDRDDEIGRLAGAFNLMAAKVQADHELLERRVAERTRELEAFSYSVSHDLRAPLRHIAGFAALLDKHASDRLDDQGKRYVRTISEAAAHMGRLVDDLLAFSRMGRADMAHADVDLGELVRDVVEEVQRNGTARTIEWIIGELPHVRGDRSMLRLAFGNIIQNAYKYTSKREVARIEIGMAPSSSDEHVVYVKDNGAGFDMKYAGKLFGVFQRLHNADDFEGTGIGLANVHRIVQRHGGRVWAEAQPGAGATFHVALPAHNEGKAE